jgi:hypothetical protein
MISDLIGRQYGGIVIEHAEREEEPGMYYVRARRLGDGESMATRIRADSDSWAVWAIEASLGRRTR